MLLVCALSALYCLGYEGRAWGGGLRGGALEVSWWPAAVATPKQFFAMARPVDVHDVPLVMWRPLWFGSPANRYVSVPLWPVGAVLCGAGLLFRREPPRQGACARCGYDFAGIAVGRFPECAADITQHLNRA